MRAIVAVCLGLALAGCANADAARASRVAEDDAKCREFGFEPGTEAYGFCRLQLEQIRAIEDQIRALEDQKRAIEDAAILTQGHAASRPCPHDGNFIFC